MTPSSLPDTDPLERFKTYVVYLTAAILAIGGVGAVVVLIIFGYVSAELGFGGIMLIIGSAGQFLFGQLQSRQAEQAVERAARRTPLPPSA